MASRVFNVACETGRRFFFSLFVAIACATHAAAQAGAVPIKHVIIIMQENRSFDSYFGTFPGANGIPQGVCVPLDPKNSALGCIKPFHNQLDVNIGGSHSAGFAWYDLDDGVTTAKMDGFVHAQMTSQTNQCAGNKYTTPFCFGMLYSLQIHDVMGYHTDAEIPNYWSYARNFVLQDNMFEAERNWSLPSHLDMTSEWAARCTDNTQARSCTTEDPGRPTKTTQYPWATFFQLLDVHNVSWKYYLGSGNEPDCDDDEMTCAPQMQTKEVGSYWNPAPLYVYVKQQGQSYLDAHVLDLQRFIADVHNNRLAQVNWIVPADKYSEHPPQGITAGMEYVTALVNAVMQSPYWQDTAIFIAWDDWGGFYDHVDPPNAFPSGFKPLPVEGFGLRVPALMISAWARPGLIDHQVYSFESYLTLVENLFAGGARLDPAALGNPDNRGVLRDSITQVTYLNGTTAPVGNLLSEFDFTQKPLPPLILNTHIPTNIFADCYPTIVQTVCQIPQVTVSWNPVTGPEVPGPFTYHLVRDGRNLPACSGTATSCVDTPGPGTHYYRVFTIGPTGEHSPQSAAAVAVVP